MVNPYEPPLSSADADSSPELITPPTSQRVRAAVVLAIGCVVGLNVSVAVDEGLESAIRRTTVDPFAALSFFTVIAIVCTLVVWVWTTIRRQVFPKYYAPSAVRFATGVVLAFASYQFMMYAERTGADFFAAVCVSLVVSTFLAVEGEVFVTKALANELRLGRANKTLNPRHLSHRIKGVN